MNTPDSAAIQLAPMRLLEGAASEPSGSYAVLTHEALPSSQIGELVVLNSTQCYRDPTLAADDPSTRTIDMNRATAHYLTHGFEVMTTAIVAGGICRPEHSVLVVLIKRKAPSSTPGTTQEGN